MNNLTPINQPIDPALEKLAMLMDDEFSILGFRFGLNFIIDLIPGVGDIVTTAIALFIFSSALKYKLPQWVIFKMIMNIVVYFVVGIIPWLGDLFGAYWKPNRRNLNLLRNYLASN